MQVSRRLIALGAVALLGGLWSAAAVWVKEGPGVGKSVAEWMVHGESHIDLHSSDVARFHADAEAVYSYEGTHEINALIVGRALTGESAFTR